MRNLVCVFILFFVLLLGTSCAQSATAATEGSVAFGADIWADNWFAFYLGDRLVIEDSVPITTERSFNKESFTFDADYPLVLNIVAKDFKENDTGLEYIGEPNQQMGDGGLIAQFRDSSTGEVIALTNSDWQCTVIHEAPLDKTCENETNPVAGEAPCEFVSLEEPEGWKSAEFDTSDWSPATVYTAAEVSPRGGYDEVAWEADAELVWGDDLETDNTLLCRLTVEAPYTSV